MPFGQLLTSIVIARGATGNPVRENIDFSDPLYNGDLFLSSFNWSFNSSEANDGTDFIKTQSSTEYYNNSTSNYPETHNADSISIIWYLASFGTLVIFFLLISFSEVCCKKSFSSKPDEETEVSPPPYDLFAPPTYDSLYAEKKGNQKCKKKGKCEVFVIHVFGDKSNSQVSPSETVPRLSTVSGHR